MGKPRDVKKINTKEDNTVAEKDKQTEASPAIKPKSTCISQYGLLYLLPIAAAICLYLIYPQEVPKLVSLVDNGLVDTKLTQILRFPTLKFLIR